MPIFDIPLLALAEAGSPAVKASIPAPLDTNTVFMGVGFLCLGAMVSVLGWFLKKQLEEILAAQSNIVRSHQSCRDTLQNRFADKQNTSDHFKILYGRTDKYAIDIAQHDMMLYGRRKHDETGEMSSVSDQYQDGSDRRG
jgi:hypothetical protein